MFFRIIYQTFIIRLKLREFRLYLPTCFFGLCYRSVCHVLFYNIDLIRSSGISLPFYFAIGGISWNDLPTLFLTTNLQSEIINAMQVVRSVYICVFFFFIKLSLFRTVCYLSWHRRARQRTHSMIFMACIILHTLK